MFPEQQEEEAFAKKLEEFAAILKPCYQTNAQLKVCFAEKYQMQEMALTDREVEQEKVQYLLNECPQVLPVQPMKLSEYGKPPTRAQFLAWCENREQVEQAARVYPLEKLPLAVSKYAVRYLLANDNYVELAVIFEDYTDNLHLTAKEGRGSLSDTKGMQKDAAEVQHIIRELMLAKGVTEEDIRTRSPRFQLYVSRLIEQE